MGAEVLVGAVGGFVSPTTERAESPSIQRTAEVVATGAGGAAGVGLGVLGLCCVSPVSGKSGGPWSVSASGGSGFSGGGMSS